MLNRWNFLKTGFYEGIKISQWKLRSWKLSDYRSLAKYANNRNIWINLRDVFPHPYNEDDARDYIRFAGGKSPETSFAIATSDEAIGAISLRLNEDVAKCSAEIGYWLGEPFWGQGIATRAVGAVVTWGFNTFDIVRIYASVFEWNPASCRVLEKNGFVFEGLARRSIIKDGETIDGLTYALVKNDS